MKRLRDDEIRIATEAAHWQRELENADPKTLAEFEDWVKASPRHLREFMFMEALEAASQGIDPDKTIPIDLNFAKSPTAISTLPVDEKTKTGARPLRGSRPRLLALAASVMTLALGLTAWQVTERWSGWTRFATDVGEQREVSLSDGSVVQLNVSSELRVRFSQNARDLRLVAGDALFKVAPDKARPFRVEAGDTVIRAIGTAFDVHRSSTGTTVAVLEGKVQIEPADDASRATPPASYLTGGEVAKIDRGSATVRPLHTPVTEAVAWRQHRLVFREESLAAIAEEFNRYNRSPQIRIEGEAARTRRFGGTFDSDDVSSLVQFVTRNGTLVAERKGDAIVVRSQ